MSDLKERDKTKRLNEISTKLSTLFKEEKETRGTMTTKRSEIKMLRGMAKKTNIAKEKENYDRTAQEKVSYVIAGEKILAENAKRRAKLLDEYQNVFGTLSSDDEGEDK